jgi:hypothetical protein
VSALTSHDKYTGPSKRAIDLVPELGTVAHRLRGILSEQGIDLAPVAELAAALNISPSVVRAAAAHAPHLGLCGTERNLMLFCLPPQPLAAGFLAEQRHGRLVLRLPVRDHKPALLINGHRIGPVPVSERDETSGSGELAHTVSRLTLMAASWLLPAADPTKFLFELITRAWRLGPTPRRASRMLAVHRADFGRPIARCNGSTTGRLVLVLNYQGGPLQLVNLYPVPEGDPDALG